MSPPRVHPDEMLRRCYWKAPVRIPSATRIATTMLRCATACTAEGCPSTVWVLKTTTGHAQNRRKLPEPVPVCGLCGADWESETVVNHLVTGAPGGGVTGRGRWTRYQHVRGHRPAPGSREEQIFGTVDLFELLRLRSLVNKLERSHQRQWAMRVYIAYVLHFSRVRGRGGETALATWASRRSRARHRAGAWKRAPFTWSRQRVSILVEEGRRHWAAELVAEGLIEGGDWWR